jgi:hypothetical protein
VSWNVQRKEKRAGIREAFLLRRAAYKEKIKAKISVEKDRGGG